MSQPKRYIACSFVHYNNEGKIGMIESRRVEDPWGEYVQWSDYIEVEKYKDKLLSDYAALAAENEVLRKKVEWLMKADRLVIWNGTEWQVRHVVEQPIKPRE